MFNKKTILINTDPQKINDLLTRGVEEVFVRESFEKKLTSGKQLRIKLGIDPTSKNIHIGRAITLRKLKAFQDLGHKVIFIVGDFTAQIGDASDKLDKRPMLTEKSVQENLKNYKKLVSKIINIDESEFVYNSMWLSKLTFKEVCELAETFSVQQMSNRRNFKERFERGEEVSLREFLYPLMQGYDSVSIKADIELGGFDQLFNLKAGRIIQKHYGMLEQDILVTQMLEGTDGRKMSSSWGNVISIDDEPQDMFGKTMSIHDSLIEKYFILCTNISLEEIDQIKKELVQGANPKDIKIRLAHEIVSIYHSKEAADKAKENFIQVFSKGGLPDVIDEISAKKGDLLGDVLVKEKIVVSKSEFRRLVQEGAVRYADTDKKITNPMQIIEHDALYKIGKRRFIKILI